MITTYTGTTSAPMMNRSLFTFYSISTAGEDEVPFLNDYPLHGNRASDNIIRMRRPRWAAPLGWIGRRICLVAIYRLLCQWRQNICDEVVRVANVFEMRAPQSPAAEQHEFFAHLVAFRFPRRQGRQFLQPWNFVVIAQSAVWRWRFPR